VAPAYKIMNYLNEHPPAVLLPEEATGTMFGGHRVSVTISSERVSLDFGEIPGFVIKSKKHRPFFKKIGEAHNLEKVSRKSDFSPGPAFEPETRPSE
jgi:hypothetical protein